MPASVRAAALNKEEITRSTEAISNARQSIRHRRDRSHYLPGVFIIVGAREGEGGRRKQQERTVPQSRRLYDRRDFCHRSIGGDDATTLFHSADFSFVFSIRD